MQTNARLQRFALFSVVGSVGALLLGVWGIIQVGGRLVAPPPLPGAWLVTAPACPAAERGLTLSQSGTFLRVRWSDPGLPELHGKVGLDGTVALSAPDGATCDASMRGRWTPSELDGELVSAGCGGCTAGALRALPKGGAGP
jgi:hypothetical protein